MGLRKAIYEPALQTSAFLAHNETWSINGSIDSPKQPSRRHSSHLQLASVNPSAANRETVKILVWIMEDKEDKEDKDGPLGDGMTRAGVLAVVGENKKGNGGEEGDAGDDGDYAQEEEQEGEQELEGAIEGASRDETGAKDN
ncbi:hypothetical protein BDK51DRAFT_31569 [Blyttiomyces helicus]|uniref:Uncharacterized protein n=1 Tax=Blyttiomyces helicus TaxID=388810 RepID=A0A4V1ISN8_9FUNG|nr:hypothetical protein BDK51DRAFT_31569 [Blyttiomyces helicus]|eukprot:RKO94207.1 hypothetical protein BDK51DRAFT_31569 [Blyttiomyces helicus]